MSSINKVILIGNVGKDPEIKSFEGGNKVANFSLATSEKFKDKNGQKQEKSEWHNIAIWGKLADVVERYVKKGDKIYLEGKLTTRSWEKDGEKKYMTEVVCNQMTMLGSRQSKQTESDQEKNYADRDDLPDFLKD